MEEIYSVYVHRTPDGMYYVGQTKNVKNRWKPNAYKDSKLYDYIVLHGWDSIEHLVVFETESREKALKTEDMLICGYAAIGRCINQHRSGLIEATDPLLYFREYSKQYRKDHADEVKLYRDVYNTKYAKEHHDEIIEHQREYNKSEHGKSVRKAYAQSEQGKATQKKYNTKRMSKPENKIYSRVKNYNAYYPDKVVETPLEAKRKYLESGYIPDYIKRDDL